MQPYDGQLHLWRRLVHRPQARARPTDGDVWYWNGYSNEFIGFGDDYYIDDDGNFYESNDAGWDYEEYNDYDPWSDPGDTWDDWSDPGDTWDDWSDPGDTWDW